MAIEQMRPAGGTCSTHRDSAAPTTWTRIGGGHWRAHETNDLSSLAVEGDRSRRRLVSTDVGRDGGRGQPVSGASPNEAAGIQAVRQAPLVTGESSGRPRWPANTGPPKSQSGSSADRGAGCATRQEAGGDQMAAFGRRRCRRWKTVSAAVQGRVIGVIGRQMGVPGNNILRLNAAVRTRGHRRRRKRAAVSRFGRLQKCAARRNASAGKGGGRDRRPDRPSSEAG